MLSECTPSSTILSSHPRQHSTKVKDTGSSIRLHSSVSQFCHLPTVYLWESYLGFIICKMYMCVLSHSVMSDSLQLYGLQPTWLFCPWDSPGKKYWRGLTCPPPGDLPDYNNSDKNYTGELVLELTELVLLCNFCLSYYSLASSQDFHRS